MASQDQLIEKLLQNVFKGQLENLPKQTSKVVRIFTSSTFTDTTVERNFLMENIYPAIKAYCRQKHGLDFQVVDMRWGVRDESTDDHMTTQLCINEINNCQRLSMGPNFVVFLCQKYGYRPLPTTIIGSELDMLKECLKDCNEDVNLLDTWYKQDSNAVPFVYVLQPISSILINYNNKRMVKLQEQDSATWWNAMGNMQTMLRRAASICYNDSKLGEQEMHNYYMSVTEREVIGGILEADHTEDHCLCYARNINNIDLANIRAASKFVDMQQGAVDKEAAELLSKLRDEKLPAKLTAHNVARFNIDWAEYDGIDAESHAEYLKEMGEHFNRNISKLVDRAMQKQQKLAGDAVYNEVLTHLHACAFVTQQFRGRQQLMQLVQEYLDSNKQHPLILHGNNGCGKTSVLAKVAEMSQSMSNKNGPVVILRFLGTTPDSSALAPLLTSLCEQICFCFKKERNQCPAEVSKLIAYFKNLLCCAQKDRGIVLILDSLDLLSLLDGAHDLMWLPTSLPKFVKLVASTTPQASNVFETLKNILQEEDKFIEIEELGLDLAVDVMKHWLKREHRDLSTRQWNIVQKALAKSTLPLFVKLIFATISKWKSYSRPQETILASSVKESIHALFNRTEKQHGKLLVSHALSYITAAKSGISESELEDLISLDDKVLDDVYQYHLPPVRRVPPLLWTRIRADLPGYLSERHADGVIVLNWYHSAAYIKRSDGLRQFHEAARERYFKNVNHMQQTHSNLADYFLGTWAFDPKPFRYTEVQRQRFGITDTEGLADRKVPNQPNLFSSSEGSSRYNLRKLSELPHHLLMSSRWQQLQSHCLFNYDFLLSKLSSQPFQMMVADFESAYAKSNDQQLKRQLLLVADGLRLSASLLVKHPGMLAFELIGRLLPLAYDNDLVKGLLVQCDMQSPAVSCLLPLHHSFHSPGGPLKFSLEEHQFAVFGLEVTKDNKLLVSVSNQFILWDTNSGHLARIINPGCDGIMFGLALSPSCRNAASYTNNNQVISVNMLTGEFISFWPYNASEQMKTQGLIMTDNEIVLWTKTEWRVYDLNGILLQQNASPNRALLKIHYFASDYYHLITYSGDRTDNRLQLFSHVSGHQNQPLRCVSSVIFTKNMRSVFAVRDGGETTDVDMYKMESGKWILDADGVTLSTEGEPILKLQFNEKEDCLVATEPQGFILWNFVKRSRIKMLLPDGVHNIALQPMNTTSPLAFTENLGYMTAGVRQCLYVWSVETGQLLQTLDGHFGRILKMTSLGDQNTLVSASIDHSIKVWNMNNALEHSFSVQRLDKSIEKVIVPSLNPNLAIAQTRKCASVWNTVHNRIVCSLSASAHGAVVTHMACTNDCRLILTIECDILLVWQMKTQSVVHRCNAQRVLQLFIMDKDQLVIVITKEEEEPRSCTITGRKLGSLACKYTYNFACLVYRDIVLLKGEEFLAVIALSKRARECIELIHAVTGLPLYKIRIKLPTDFDIDKLFPLPHNTNQVAVQSVQHSAIVWDVKNKKALRTLPKFSGVCTSDAKLGVYAPVKGGLYLIDMRKGDVVNTLIPTTLEGLVDAMVKICPTDKYVMYYHNAKRTLSLFRISDAVLVGSFVPHAQLTCFVMTPDSSKLLIGGEDGSLVTCAIIDPMQPGDLENLAVQPGRAYLAEHMGFQVKTDDEWLAEQMNLANLKIVAKAVKRFKSLLSKNKQRSALCLIQ